MKKLTYYYCYKETFVDVALKNNTILAESYRIVAVKQQIYKTWDIFERESERAACVFYQSLKIYEEERTACALYRSLQIYEQKCF